MQNKIKSRLLALTCLATLAACSGGGSGGGDGGSNGQLQPDKIVELSYPLFMDKLGVVPTKGSYLININNLSAKNYTLDSVKVTDASGENQSNLLEVSAQMCERLVANGSCSIELTPKTVTSKVLLLAVGLRDSKNELHQVQQIVRISDKLVGDSGISFAVEAGEVVTETGEYRIAIPVVLNEDFDDVQTSTGSLSCGSEGFKAGSTCTYKISGKALADNTIVSADIRGYRAGELVVEQAINLNVKIGKVAELVLSQGVTLEADGSKEAEVIVFNDGNEEATGVSYTTTLPEGVINPQSCNTIAPHEMCAIKVKAKSQTNGSGLVTAVFNTDRTAGTNISYTGIARAGVNITSIGSLENIYIHGQGIAKFTLENTGHSILTDLKISLLEASDELQVLNGASCPKELAVGDKCTIEIIYQPKQVQKDGSAKLSVTANYIGLDNKPNSYETQYPVLYSSDTIVGPITVTPTDGFVFGGSIIQGSSFSVVASLNEDIEAQTISVANQVDLEKHGISITQDPTSSCVFSSNGSSCTFTVYADWNLAKEGTYDLQLNSSGNVTPSPKSIKFSVIKPEIYLPQTGALPYTPGSDGAPAIGLSWPKPRFIPQDDCITDSLTGLMWARDANMGKKDWLESIKFISDMNDGEGLCGYKDWHLPNINEQLTLMNYGVQSQKAWLQSQGFSDVQEYYWTSTTRILETLNAWEVFTTDGMGYYASKTNSKHNIWPVRLVK